MKNKTYILIALLSIIIGSCRDKELSLIPYKSADKWGYIDREGKILINPQFNYANIFIGGVALVKSADDKFGYIGEDGKYRINAAYKDATFFSEGLACVVPENGKPQFIDDKGNVKFTVTTGEVCGILNEELASVKIGEKWGFLDKEGNIKINAQFDYAYPFSEGLAAVSKKNNENAETLWGFVNKKGEIAINYQFKWVGKFNNGLAIASDGKKYGFIDKTGKYTINPQFDFIGELVNGRAIIKQGSMFGYIDINEKIVINPQFNSAQAFSSNGMASVSSSDGKYGYIDENGKYAINPQFDYASEFYGDIAFVKSADKMGIINEKGKYLVNPQYDHMNVDNKNYKYKTVESDYFDVNEISENFLEGTDEKSFRKFTTASTISDLKNFYPNLFVDIYNWKASTSENITLNAHSYINNLGFTFSENPVLDTKPVFKTERQYSAQKGGYYDVEVVDHYENIQNDNATLQSVTFNFYLSDNKAINKSEQIFKAIIDALTTKATLTPTASSSVFKNDNMTVTVGGNGMNKGKYAVYQIVFK